MMHQSQASSSASSSAPASLRSLKAHVIASRKQSKLLRATPCHPDPVLCLSVVGLTMLPVAFAIGSSITKALECREIARNKTRRAAFIRSCRASIEVDPRVHDAFIFWSIELALNFGDRDLGRFTPKRPLTSFSLEEWDIYRRECSKKQARNAAAVSVDNMDASKIPIAKVTTPPVSSDVAIVEPKLSVDQSPRPSESKDVPAVQSTRNKNTIHIAPVSQSTTSVPIKTSVSQFATLRIISSRKFTPTYTISPSILPATISMNISILEVLKIALPIVPSTKTSQTVVSKPVTVLFKIISTLSASRLQVAWALVSFSGKWFIFQVLVSDNAIRVFVQHRRICYSAPLLLEAAKPSALASACVLLSLACIPKPTPAALPTALTELLRSPQVSKHVPYTSLSPILFCSITPSIPSAPVNFNNTPILKQLKISLAVVPSSKPSPVVVSKAPIILFKVISTLSTSRRQIARALVWFAGKWFIVEVLVLESAIQGFAERVKICYSAPLLLEAPKPSVLASRCICLALDYISKPKAVSIPTALLKRKCLLQILKPLAYFSFSPLLLSSFASVSISSASSVSCVSTASLASPISSVSPACTSVSVSPVSPNSLASTVCSDHEASACIKPETTSCCVPVSTLNPEYEVEPRNAQATTAVLTADEPESKNCHDKQDSSTIQSLDAAKSSVLASRCVLLSLNYFPKAKPVEVCEARGEQSSVIQISEHIPHSSFSPVVFSSSACVPISPASPASPPSTVSLLPLSPPDLVLVSPISPAPSICTALRLETTLNADAEPLLIQPQHPVFSADVVTTAAAKEFKINDRHGLHDSVSFNPWASQIRPLTIDTTNVPTVENPLSPTLTSSQQTTDSLESSSPETPSCPWVGIDCLDLRYESLDDDLKRKEEFGAVVTSQTPLAGAITVDEEGLVGNEVAIADVFEFSAFYEALDQVSLQTANDGCADISFNSLFDIEEHSGTTAVIEDDIEMKAPVHTEAKAASHPGDDSMISLFGEEDEDADASGISAAQFEMWVEDDEQDNCRATENMDVAVSAIVPTSSATFPVFGSPIINAPVPSTETHVDEDVCMELDTGLLLEDTEMVHEQPNWKATTETDVEMGSRDQDCDVEKESVWRAPRCGVPIILSKLALPGTKPMQPPPPAALPAPMEVVAPHPLSMQQNETPIAGFLPRLGDPFAFSLSIPTYGTESPPKAPGAVTTVDLTSSAFPPIAAVLPEDSAESTAPPVAAVVLPAETPSLPTLHNNISSEPAHVTPLDLLASKASIASNTVTDNALAQYSSNFSSFAELHPPKAPGVENSLGLTWSTLPPISTAVPEESAGSNTSPVSTAIQPFDSPSLPIQNTTPPDEPAFITPLEPSVETKAVDITEDAVSLLLGLRHIPAHVQETPVIPSNSTEETPASTPSSASFEEWSAEECAKWDDMLEEEMARDHSDRTSNDLARFDTAAEELHQQTEKLVQKTREWESSLPTPTFVVRTDRWDDNETPAFDLTAMKRHQEDGDLPDSLVATLEQEATAFEASNPPSSGHVPPLERKIRALPTRRTRKKAAATNPAANSKEETSPSSRAPIEVVVVNGVTITTDADGEEWHDNGEGEILCW